MNLIGKCKSFFGISQKEARGFIIIQIIMLFVILLPGIIEQILPERKSETTQASSDLDSVIAVLDKKVEQSQKMKNKSFAEYGELLTSFDPNEATKDIFLKAGINNKLAERILKYREKGGRFWKKDDLLKIYGMNKVEFEKIAHLIRIQKNESTNKRFVVQAQEPFDINKADSVQLVKLPEIGPALAKRILKYRNLLGGFVSKTQYPEIFGLTEEAQNQLKKNTFVGQNYEPEKIDILVMDFRSISAHPYLGYEAAKRISKHKKSGFERKVIYDLLRNDTTLKLKNPALLARYLVSGD